MNKCDHLKNEFLEQVDAMKTDNEVKLQLKIQILQLTCELESSIMMMELKKKEEIEKAQELLASLHIDLIGSEKILLSVFCKN